MLAEASELVQIINACLSLLGLLIPAYLIYLTNRNARSIEQNSKSIELIHKATNSMKDELVKEVRQASFAEGVKSQQDLSVPPVSNRE
jgi:hypothetical protein